MKNYMRGEREVTYLFVVVLFSACQKNVIITNSKKKKFK